MTKDQTARSNSLPQQPEAIEDAPDGSHPKRRKVRRAVRRTGTGTTEVVRPQRVDGGTHTVIRRVDRTHRKPRRGVDGPTPPPEASTAPVQPAQRVRVRSLVTALAVAALVVAAADLLARRAVSLSPTEHCYDVPRNPHFRRGWRQYTEPRERPKNTRLVVVISNSQGYSREQADGADAFPAQLEKTLQQADPQHDYIVTNWSVAGGYAPEMIVLAARAAQHQPDLVIWSTYAVNFLPGCWNKPLSYSISDAPELAYLPAVRALLPERFLTKLQASDPLAVFSVYSGLGQARARYIEQRTEKWEFVVGARPRDLARIQFKMNPLATPVTRAFLNDFHFALRRGSPETKMMLVAMPLVREAFTNEAWEINEGFVREAQEYLGPRPRVQVVDVSTAVEQGHFYDQSHMKPGGHERFCRLLEQPVLDTLGE